MNLSFLTTLNSILMIVGGAIPALAAAATAFVMFWHGMTMLMQAVSMIPGLSGVAGLAQKLKIAEDSISAETNGKILPLLNRLSALPLPRKSA